MSFFSKLYRASQEAYWNAVDNCPELMGVDPTQKPQEKTPEVPAEPPAEPAAPAPLYQYAPQPAVPQMPAMTPVYIMMQAPDNRSYPAQALIPPGYRLITEEEYEELIIIKKRADGEKK